MHSDSPSRKLFDVHTIIHHSLIVFIVSIDENIVNMFRAGIIPMVRVS